MTESENDPGVELGELVQISLKPPRYTWAVNGRVLELRAGEILSQKRFHRVCFERLGIWPTRIGHAAWQALVNECLSVMKTVPEGEP